MYYIYKMIHVPTGRVYVGQRRCPAGKTPETDSYHGSGKIWKCIYNAHPDECVKVVIETCFTKEAVNRLEVSYIEQYKHFMGDRCVNVAPGGDGVGSGEDNPWFGKRLSEEHRRKISEAEKGEKNSMFGKRHSEETKRKMSETIKVKCLSEEYRMKLSEAHKGKLHSDEHKRKIGEAQKGEKNPMFGKHLSEETKRKMSEARKAYWARKKALSRKENA